MANDQSRGMLKFQTAIYILCFFFGDIGYARKHCPRFPLIRLFTANTMLQQNFKIIIVVKLLFLNYYLSFTNGKTRMKH